MVVKLALVAAVILGASAHASTQPPCRPMAPCRYEIAQQPSDAARSPASGQTSTGANGVMPDTDKTNNKAVDKQRIERLRTAIDEQAKKVSELRKTNHAWNIFFVATGVSMTLLATSLGAVGSAGERAKARTTITIAIIGAVAAAAQTIASKIPVAKRAGEYAKIQSALVALHYRAQDIKTEAEFSATQNEFMQQIQKIGETEAAD